MEERFIEKIHFTTECWYWTAYKDRQGYGRFTLGGWSQRAHRVSYELFVGPIPDGLEVLHKCDNPSCVNPGHLEVGTNLLNMQQKAERGRSAKGEDHGSAKLTEEQVLEIRQRFAEGGVSKTALAEEYGVSRTTIRRLVRREIWAHL